MHLTTLDFVVIVAYLGGLTLIGLHFSKQQTSREEYLLGSRNVHWLLAAGSVLATLLSTITFLALPGETIRYGIAFSLGLIALPLVVPVVNYILLPVLMSLRITSMYEYLERRFDVRARSLAATVFTARTLLWMGLVIYTCSFAVTTMTGWNIYWTIVVLGVVTTFYTSAGGMRTVIWTDNLQLWILGGGAIAIPIYIGVSIGSGPAAWWDAFSAAGHTKIEVFSWDLTIRLTVIGAMMSQFFWNACTNGSDQVAVQRFLSTPSLAAARRSMWSYMGMNFALNFLLVFCGLALFAFYHHRSGLAPAAFQAEIALKADRVMPEFIVQELPAGISGLVLAALLAAAMSSLSSGINSISGVVGTDFIERHNWVGESGMLRASKIVSVVAGAAGVLVALGVTYASQRTDWNLVELTQRVNHLTVGPIAVLFFSGILFRRAGFGAAGAGFLTGLLVSLFVAFGKELFGLPQSVSFTWLVPFSFSAGFAAAGLASLIVRR
ncbi:MAG: sodium/solute symporter [Bryobacterales bacterium]|nr:sodium/solute symporter [Bryobacterales bacterium]